LKTQFKITGLLLLFAVLSGCKKDEVQVEVPQVFTESVSNVGETSVSASGSVASDGGGEIEERGFVLSTGPTPTVETGIVRLAGTGVGPYSSQITGLLGGTSYYLRAFATNKAGTGYGEALLFTTDQLFGFSFQGSTIWGYPEDNMIWAVWGPQENLGATNATNGQGNTQTIAIYSMPSGAKTCNTLSAFGHSNWYLPAINELVAVYENQDLWGNFYNPLGIYWSSTEVSATEGYAVDFATGEVSVREKNSQAGCRCVRRTF
jgi:hypothetical protein